ncbi:MAG TPA: endo alpha-1,4 polygalactosaminidase [Myxococcota bacterium]|nr:endo alpha-1,4 polygalactosaminidase [Myxococcota bacterium]
MGSGGPVRASSASDSDSASASDSASDSDSASASDSASDSDSASASPSVLGAASSISALLAALPWLAIGCGGRGAGDAGGTSTDAVSRYDAGAGPVDAGAAPGGVWRPLPGTSWQWQLQGIVDTSFDVQVYDIDLFDVPEPTIAALHAAGRIVVCYFSAGSLEDWREDAGAFVPADAGNPLAGWPGETWLDTRSANVRAVMRARLDMAGKKGCDGVEPDNVDGYANDSGFPLTAADQLDYDRFLATEAHARALSAGLKNATDLVPDLEPDFDWALNEECLAFAECATEAPFLAAGKAVFHVEYVNDCAGGPALASSVCGDPTAAGFSTLVKTWDLDAWRLACP